MTQTYQLTCTDCSYEREASGREQALDRAEEHAENYDHGHFVDVHLVESTAVEDDAMTASDEQRSYTGSASAPDGSVSADDDD